jgi:protein-tyrosine phosphatase
MDKIKVLFVCLGNICRSPSAESVFKHIVKQNGFENQIEIDSAGTIGYHAGEKADPRMRTHAAARGYNITHIARKFNPQKDFDYFDYIIAMDDSNFTDVSTMDARNEYSNKIKKMIEYSIISDVKEIPDPYYSGPEGFEKVLDLLEDACTNLFEEIKDELASKSN